MTNTKRKYRFLVGDIAVLSSVTKDYGLFNGKFAKIEERTFFKGTPSYRVKVHNGKDTVTLSYVNELNLDC